MEHGKGKWPEHPANYARDISVLQEKKQDLLSCTPVTEQQYNIFVYLPCTNCL